MTDKIKIEIRTIKGEMKMGEYGYMVIRSDNVVAFYLDAWTKTGRAYPISTCQQIYLPYTQSVKHYPSIMIDDGDDNFAEIHFPEFEGWQVHCADGGKTMSICLVKRN